MKKAIVALAFASYASVASAAIAGESHDLSASGPNANFRDATYSACQYCHAPHNVNTTVTGAPLWNRNAPAGPFTPYTSLTLNQTANAVPNANSATCLSCHDGSSAVGDMYANADVTFTTNTMAASYANVGTDLTDDHPVSIRYVPAAGQFDSVANVTAGGQLNLYGAAGSETVECGSCHDPHGDSDGATSGPSFLRMSAGAICTECHLK